MNADKSWLSFTRASLTTLTTEGEEDGEAIQKDS